MLIPICIIFSLPIALISIDNFLSGSISGAIIGFIIAGVCLLCSLGLYAPYSFFFAFKLIGLTIFIGYVAYSIDCLQAGHIYETKRSAPAFINAILGLFFWGLPGLMLFMKGSKPKESPYTENGKLKESED